MRTLVQRELSAALERHDVLVSPVAPTAAYRIGERSADPLAMYKGDLMTVPINLAGKRPLCGLQSKPDNPNTDGLLWIMSWTDMTLLLHTFTSETIGVK